MYLDWLDNPENRFSPEKTNINKIKPTPSECLGLVNMKSNTASMFAIFIAALEK